MKKTNGPIKARTLTLRREHIRILTPADLENAIGGAGTKTTAPPPPTSNNCTLASNKAAGC